ncbi:hypothetical protein D3C81_2196210 [compost metagenome]
MPRTQRLLLPGLEDFRLVLVVGHGRPGLQQLELLANSQAQRLQAPTWAVLAKREVLRCQLGTTSMLAIQ